MHKDVTVSKLSRLQKQILLYARQQMLAKGQVIEPRNDVTVNIPAPPWLNDVLTKTLSKIFKVRRDHFGVLRHEDKLDVHDWVWFFEEIAFVTEAIKSAAKEAGYWRKLDLDLRLLYEWALPVGMAFGLSIHQTTFHPWPYYHGGWYFRIDIQNMTADKIMEDLISWEGEEAVKATGLWLDTEPHCPINCTVPEMLRDLFGFKVRGHIDALAFSPGDVGIARYNSAQASLRRACTRLKTRGLIWERAGQRSGLQVGFFNRSGIGLTEQGVAVADCLGGLNADQNRNEGVSVADPAQTLQNENV